jgi:hypothetical protein
MFRRRGSMRRFRRDLARSVPPLLQQANQFLANGNYTQAANTFEQLARWSEARFPERTPFLYLEAGQASILDGQIKTGIAHFRRGLTLLATQGRFPRMHLLGQRVMRELNARGLKEEATEIAGLLAANLPQQISHEQVPIKKPILPTHCPNCGGSLRPDEIEWLDEVTAECSYCGSPVRGEN